MIRSSPRAQGKYVADHIPGAKYVELPGSQPLPHRGAVAVVVSGDRRVPHRSARRMWPTIGFLPPCCSPTSWTRRAGPPRSATATGMRCSMRMTPSCGRSSSRFRGREVNTSGDGFLAMFDGPQRAIRCAMAIRDAVQSLGIEVRAGLHTGECEVRGDDIGGIAVHIGARVSALAAAERRAGVQHAARPGDRVGARIRGPRCPRAEGRARRVASFRRRLYVASSQNGGGLLRSAIGFGGVGVVEFAFGGNGFGFVGRAGVPAFGHHRAAVAGGFGDGWFVGPQGGGGLAQLWEQVLAARICDIGVPGWCGPHDGPVG